MIKDSRSETAFVLAGGGSLGAVQVGMLKALAFQDVKADFVVGTSVGAINAAYFAGEPTIEGARPSLPYQGFTARFFVYGGTNRAK